MPSNLFRYFIFGILILSAGCDNIDSGEVNYKSYQSYKNLNTYKSYQSYTNSKRIEIVNQIAKMVDLVKPEAEYQQSYGLIWFLICIYIFIGLCFCLGCFAFMVKKYTEYQVYIKEVNYMNNRV